VNNVRTVSETKRAFYTTHTRPINSIYRRVVEELMVEMHLLAVNSDFRYDPIYALGVVTAFNGFMQGYRPEADINSIFEGLCKALQEDPNRYRHDAERLGTITKGLSDQELVSWLEQSLPVPDAGDLQEAIRAIAHNPQFKYSRLFAIGVYTLLELSNPELTKEESQRTEALKKVCAALNLPEEKFQKDLELYRSNLEKMAQARIVMEDALQAERKKREDREKAKAAAASTPPSDSSESKEEV
jgi:photosystem II biogenesis protein Psp29